MLEHARLYLPSRVLVHAMVVVGWMLAASRALSAAESYPRVDLLVEPAILNEQLSAGQVLAIDARPQGEYDAGHLPGARWVDAADWAKSFGDGTDQAGWTDRLGALGLKLDSPVVIYDDSKSKDAARVWWILSYWGIERGRLLNGGWHGWKSASLPIDRTAPTFATTTPELSPRSQRLVSKDQLLAALAGQSLQIIDARSDGEFCGTAAMGNKRAGAVPGAKRLEWSDLIEADTQRFKPASELKRLFAAAGIDVTRPTATYCQSGGRASVMQFGLELMGADQVRNYYRSWSEWGNADDTPIVPGGSTAAPSAK